KPSGTAAAGGGGTVTLRASPGASRSGRRTAARPGAAKSSTTDPGATRPSRGTGSSRAIRPPSLPRPRPREIRRAGPGVSDRRPRPRPARGVSVHVEPAPELVARRRAPVAIRELDPVEERVAEERPGVGAAFVLAQHALQAAAQAGVGLLHRRRLGQHLGPGL